MTCRKGRADGKVAVLFSPAARLGKCLAHSAMHPAASPEWEPYVPSA
jgi:hypothetical protein